MKTPINRLKSALTAGEVQYGIWLSSGSPHLAEMAGHAGFDWCLIDGEHGPTAVTDLTGQLQALSATGASAVVRVPSANVWLIKQALDQGCQTVLVPMVDDAATAAQMARAMRYPPDGIRGMGASSARASFYGQITDYAQTANAQICLLVQAESRAALDNIDEIAATSGVDGVFVGPADLSADMGYPGQPDHPEVIAAIDHIIARTRAAGKIAGIITFDAARVPAYLAQGVTFMGVCTDITLLNRALTGLVQRLKTPSSE